MYIQEWNDWILRCNTFSFRRCCPAGFVSGLPIYAPVSSSSGSTSLQALAFHLVLNYYIDKFSWRYLLSCLSDSIDSNNYYMLSPMIRFSNLCCPGMPFPLTSTDYSLMTIPWMFQMLGSWVWVNVFIIVFAFLLGCTWRPDRIFEAIFCVKKIKRTSQTWHDFSLCPLQPHWRLLDAGRVTWFYDISRKVLWPLYELQPH